MSKLKFPRINVIKYYSENKGMSLHFDDIGKSEIWKCYYYRRVISLTVCYLHSANHYIIKRGLSINQCGALNS